MKCVNNHRREWFPVSHCPYTAKWSTSIDCRRQIYRRLYSTRDSLYDMLLITVLIVVVRARRESAVCLRAVCVSTIAYFSEILSSRNTIIRIVWNASHAGVGESLIALYHHSHEQHEQHDQQIHFQHHLRRLQLKDE